jgi:hypothetical protein
VTGGREPWWRFFWWAALPILVTVSLAAAVNEPWLAFIPVGLLTVAWILGKRWSWPRGTRARTLLLFGIVGVVAAAFLVQQIPDENNDAPTAQQQRLAAEQGVREAAGESVKDVSCVELHPSGPDYYRFNCEAIYKNGRCREWGAAVDQNEGGYFQQNSRKCASTP